MSKIIKRAKLDSTVSSSTQNLPDAFKSNAQPQLRRSRRITNGVLQDDTFGIRKDPVSTILPEVLAEVYKYCSNSDVCRLRLVSSSWKNSVEEIWRKRVTIYFYKDNTIGSKRTGSLTEFSDTIQDQEFDFSNQPLRRFKFFKFGFILQNYNATTPGRSCLREFQNAFFSGPCGHRVPETTFQCKILNDMVLYENKDVTFSIFY